LSPELEKEEFGGEIWAITHVSFWCSQDSFFVASEVLKRNPEEILHKIIYSGKDKLVSELTQ